MDIPFPFEPYPQQRDLMSALYEAIASSKSGCFESPTGTGKSLSVICAALCWQEREETRILEGYEKEIAASTISSNPPSNDDWLADIMQGDSKTSAEKILKQKKGELDRFIDVKARIAKTLRGHEVEVASSSSLFGAGPGKITEPTPAGVEVELAEDSAFVLPMYDSEDAANTVPRSRHGRKKTPGLVQSDSYDSGGDDEDIFGDTTEEETDLPLPKIFYCSRTHTQIAQFVSEIRRTCYANARVVTLGSRKNLCIHPTVSRLASDVRMSDQCLEMQKNSASKTTNTAIQSQDPHNPRPEKKKHRITRSAACELHVRRLEERFALHALGQIRDIEELVSLGRTLKACPYYSTRRAVRYAQVVCMPYNMLIHADLRASMGIDVRGSVVIFDEAHNLVDAVNHTHSAELTLLQLDLAASAINSYLERFQLQLGGRNVYYINLLSSVTRKLRVVMLGELANDGGGGVGLVQSSSSSSSSSSHLPPASSGSTTAGTALPQTTLVFPTNDFTFRARLDNINLFKLRRHMMETNLVARIGGFTESQARRAEVLKGAPGDPKQIGENPTSSCSGCNVSHTDDSSFTAASHALRSLLSLLSCLTNNDADGRVSITRQATTLGPYNSHAQPSCSLRFILLNPSVPFSLLVGSARSVILLGGTLRPFSLVASSLFSGKPTKDLSYFSCGHVVDRSSIAAFTIGSGPGGHSLEFTHSLRQSKQTLDELHGVLLQTCQAVPHGFVCFFTSYAYMETVMSAWRLSGQLGQLSRYKPVMCESRSATECDAVWGSYCTAAALPRGALLMCVMGGKLSEGINFSDHLARCVAVVGMPYPDLRDPILQEKLKHSDSIEPNSGKQLYEAMCMKSINQSIGRSIRHVKDYAAIMLIDRRFSQSRVISQLPSWIEGSVSVLSKWSDTRRALEEFFASKAL